MRWYANEVAPAAPLLIPLAEVMLWAIAFMVCIAVVYFAKAFFGVTGTLLGKLPVVGGWLDAGAHAIEQRITNTFAAAAASCDAKMGAALHSLARFVDKLGAEIVRHANLLLTLAQFIPGANFTVTLLRDVIALRKVIAALFHRVEGIGHDLIGRIGHIERGIGADVLPRIRSLDRRLGRVVTKDLPAIRAREAELEHGAAGTWKWLRSHPWSAATGAFAGLVALALTKLGLSWVRCESAKQVFRKRGCGMWNDLDALLAAAVGVAASMSLLELAKAEQEVVEDISTVVRRFWQA